MPFERYECQQCGDKFLFFSQLWETKRQVRCPRCGAEVRGSSPGAGTQEKEDSGNHQFQTNQESS